MTACPKRPKKMLLLPRNWGESPNVIHSQATRSKFLADFSDFKVDSFYAPGNVKAAFTV